MTTGAAERDDPLLTLQLHGSTVQLLVSLLRTLADLDLLLGVLADELVAASRPDAPVAGAG